MTGDAATAGDLATVAAGFGAVLHEGGIPVTPERSARFAATVALAHPESVRGLYWLARVTLLDAHEQLDYFDWKFAQIFGGMVDAADHRGDSSAPELPPDHRPGPPRSSMTRPPAVDTGVPAPAGAAGSPQQRDSRREPQTVVMTASAEERLRRKDFAACTPEELAMLKGLVAQLRVVAPWRRARRTVGHPTGRRLDVRRTLRRLHRTGGDPVRREYRRRRQRRRRIVLIADVSGSMEAYARVYLHLLQGAVRGARAEAFVFATRLTRLTSALAAGHPDVALARAAETTQDWSGGTRIADSLKSFLDDHGRRGMARGAVVVVVSDGWERGDPALLAEQMARLRRLAYRIVWVNPRSAAEQYKPLVGGMAAALPFVDTLVAGHSLNALDDVLTAIGQ